MTNGQPDDILLDDLVEEFEAARAESDADLASYLPPEGHPQYGETLVELIRVDLEFSWQTNQRPDLAAYRDRFHKVLDDPERFASVAFEEFRLRRAAGEACTREDYRDRFGVPSHSWPELPVGQAADNGSGEDSWLRELSQADPAAANRIADATRQLPQVGDRFLDFELVGELGRGAFGRAYLARQGDLANRFVALKVTAQITDEPQRLAQLQHTNIVPIYSLHQQGLLQAVCMPFLGPNTLADVLHTFRANRSLPNSGHALVSTMAARQASTVMRETDQLREDLHAVRTGDKDEDELACGRELESETLRQLDKMSYLDAAVWIVARLAGGLAHAHEHGIVHRDLKPANILLSDDGEPLILDFNLSSQSSAAGSSAALVGGTLPYMAPEHIIAFQQGCEVGPAADIYALGVILFEMLTGELPFPDQRGSFDEVTTRMLADRQRPAALVTDRNRNVPGDLAAIVSKCLAMSLEDRYTSANALQDDLQRHLDNLPLRYAGGEPLAERAKKWCRRHPRLTSAASVTTVATLLVVALLVAWLVRGRQVARLEARERARRFIGHVASARTALNLAGIDNAMLRKEVASAEHAAELYHLLSGASVDQDSHFQLVPLDQQQQLRREGAELLYLIASGKALLGARAEADAHRHKFFDEALRLNALTAASFAEPVPKAVLLQRARLLAAAGRDDDAQQAREQADATSAESFFDRRLLAAEWNLAGNYAATIELLESVLRNQPQDYTAWFGLGSAHYRLGNYASAESCFTTCLALQPQLDLANFMRGVARLGLKSFQKAKGDFDVVLRRRRNYPAALVNRALARSELGELDEAIADLSLAIDAGISETRVYFLRARLRQQAGHVELAAADRAEGLRRTPRDEVSWIARGVARMKDGPEAALADLREALRINPQSATAMQNIAYILSEQLGRNDEAVRVMDRLVKASPGDPLARVNRGVLLARLQRKDEALGDAAAALQGTPPPAVVYRAACIYALLAGDDDSLHRKAVKQLGRALRAGSSLVATAVGDSDLDAIHDDPAVRQLISAALLLERTSQGLK